MKPNLKKVVSFLVRWDGIWSVPLTLLLFVGFTFAGEAIWKNDFGAMSPSFYHAVIYAIAVVVALNLMAWLGMRLNWHAVFNYYAYTRDPDNGHSFECDFNSLTPMKRICVLLFLYAFPFLAAIIVIAAVV